MFIFSGKDYKSGRPARRPCYWIRMISNFLSIHLYSLVQAYQSGHPARRPSTPGAGWPLCFYLYIFTLWSKLPNLDVLPGGPPLLEQDGLYVSIYTFLLIGPSLPIWTSCQAALHSWSRMASMFLSVQLLRSFFISKETASAKRR